MVLSGESPATIENTWSVLLGDMPLVPIGSVAGSLDVEVPANLVPGNYDVSVTSPSGESDLLEDAIFVTLRRMEAMKFACSTKH